MRKLLQKMKGKAKAGVFALTAMLTALVAPTAAMADPIDFSGMDGVTVTPTDVIGTGFSFASMFDQFTLLILGIIFAPVAIGFIIWLLRKLPRFGGGRSN